MCLSASFLKTHFTSEERNFLPGISLTNTKKKIASTQEDIILYEDID